MSATESLDEYIRKFQNHKGKYNPSLLSSSFSETITDTVSSIDTEELLSDTSSNSYSEYLNPKKNYKLKHQNQKHKKKHTQGLKGLKQPSHLKPLHRTPLKIINEEEESSLYQMKYDISQFLPHEYGAVQRPNLDMRNTHHQPTTNQIGDRVRNVYYNYRDIDSDTYSTCSSVDTEALLNSSDEEDIEVTINKIKKVSQKKSQPAISKKRDNVEMRSKSPSKSEVYSNKQITNLTLPARDIPSQYLPYTPNPDNYRLKSQTAPATTHPIYRPPPSNHSYYSIESDEYYRQTSSNLEPKPEHYRPYEQYLPNIPNYQPKLMRSEMVQVSEGAFNPRLYISESSLSDASQSPSTDMSKMGYMSSPDLPQLDILHGPALPPSMSRYTIPQTNRTNASEASPYRRDAPADTCRSNYNPMLSINSDSHRKLTRTQSPSIEKKEDELPVYGDSFSHESVHHIPTPAFSNRKPHGFPNLYQESERLRTIHETNGQRDSFESTIQACIKQESDRRPNKVYTIRRTDSVCIEPVSHESSANSASMQTRSSMHIGMLDTLGRSYIKPTEKKTIQLKICTCILQGYEKTHTKHCRPIEITAFMPEVIQRQKMQRMTYNEAAIRIQRAWRKCRRSRIVKKPSVQFYVSSSPLLTPLEESFSKKDLDTSRSSMDYKQESTNTLTYSQSVMNSTAEIEKATKSLYQALDQLKALKKFTTTQDSLDSSLTFTDSCFSKGQAKNQLDVSESIISSAIQSPFLSPHALKSWQTDPKSISTLKLSPINEPNFLEHVRMEHDFLQDCQDVSRSSDDTEALLNSSDSFLTSG